jgi:hypothetical protein
MYKPFPSILHQSLDHTHWAPRAQLANSLRVWKHRLDRLRSLPTSRYFAPPATAGRAIHRGKLLLDRNLHIPG